MSQLFVAFLEDLNFDIKKQSSFHPTSWGHFLNLKPNMSWRNQIQAEAPSFVVRKFVCASCQEKIIAKKK